MDIIVILLIIIIGLLLFLIYLFFRKTEIEKISEKLKTEIRNNFSEFSKNIGELKNISATMQNKANEILKIFEKHTPRGKFGEFELETIISDILPKKYWKKRKRIPGIGTPDITIFYEFGKNKKIIPIDSKFVLENYQKMIEAQDEKEKKRYKNELINDILKHGKDVKEYVNPKRGVHVAFMYIPSEGLFYFIISEAEHIIKELSKNNVFLVSPYTLEIYLTMLLYGIHGIELSEKAEKINEYIQKLRGDSDKLEKDLNVLFEHIKNAYKKREDVEKDYKELHFDLEKSIEETK